MKKIAIISGLFLLIALAGRVQAAGLALGAKVGTLGLGGDVTVRLHNRFNVRATGNWMKWDADGSVDEVDFTYGLDFTTYGGMLDFHPFANGFRLSGGLLFVNNSTTVKATPSESKKIGDHTYTPEQIGTIDGTVNFERDPAPYIGIGYGNAVDENQSFSFIFNLGVMLQKYNVKLSATGAAASSPEFRNDLNELETDTQDDLDSWKFYPVLSFGLAYQF